MRSLDRKLFRELWRLKGQMLSIAAVVAAGIMTVVTMRGGYETLLDARADYYERTRFADVWASLERAPESLRGRIEAIPGVVDVGTRVTFLANLDLSGIDGPGVGQFVSLPDRGRPSINDVVVVQGRFPLPEVRGEVLVSENFAAARAIEPGHVLTAVVSGRRRTFRVAGVAISPEHTYAVPPGALLPEDDRYGILWARRDVLAAAYDMEGAFNQVVLRLAPGGEERAVLARLDRILEPYGGLGAYPRADQPSHLILQGELDQNRVTGTAIPLVFLAVAAFLLNLVLGRLIDTQRTEIAVLKAFGYSNREVGLHYLAYALAAVTVGTLVGGLVGAWLGGIYIELYREYFDFPDLRYSLSPSLLLGASAVSALAAAAGALGAVRKAVALPPAEAMRPEAPPTFRPGPLERTGLGRAVPPAARMILRNVERRPVRALLSSLGVAFSVAILVVGMFAFDGTLFLMDFQFRIVQREDLTVTFERPTPASVRYELARLEGVTRVETFRAVPARLRSGLRDEEVSLRDVEADARLRRVVGADGRVHPLPAEGVVMSAILADRLGVAVGDAVDVEVLDGRRRQATTSVAGVVEDFLGVSAYMHPDALRRLTADGDVVSGAHLATRRGERIDVTRALADLPAVAGVASPARTLAAFEDQLGESLYVAVAFLVGFAGVISVGIIYNGARIALSERGRELASLRVMGFRRREVSVLLLGEQAVVTLLAIPVGWSIGWGLAASLVSSLEMEAYRIPLVISPRTYVLSALVTGLAAAASGWIVRRRIDNLDLIAVLKTRE